MQQVKDNRANLPERFRETLPESFLTNLSIAEERLLHATANGVRAVGGSSDLDGDPTNHAETAQAWPDARRVRSSLIRWLCTEAASKISSHGIQLYGARIAGQIDLANLKLSFPIQLLRCQITDGADLSYIQLPSIAFTGSAVGWINLSYVRTRGDLALDGGFSCSDGATFYTARIGGDLYCANGHFRSASGFALNAEQVTIEGSMVFSDGFLAQGGIIMRAAHIKNDVSCRQGRFVANHDQADPKVILAALNAESAIVGGRIFLDNGFSAEGAVSFIGIQIDTDLICDGGSFKNPEGDALNAAGAVVKGSVFLDQKFSAHGIVNLASAQIGGNLDCEGGQFSAPSGWALDVEVASIGGSLLMNSCTVQGGVHLRAIHIRNELDCGNGHFTANRGKQQTAALQAMSAGIGSGVLLTQGFSADGSVNFDLAQIGGDLDCEGGRFKNTTDDALSAGGAGIKGSVLLRGKFSSEGRVFLMNMQVEGDLDCEGGQFSAAKGESLNAERATVGGSVYLRKGFKAQGEVNVRAIHVRTDLDCSDAHFAWNNEDAHCLNAAYAVIGGNGFFFGKFLAEGTLSLDLAQIAGDLDCGGGGVFRSDNGVALSAETIVVKGGIFFNRKFTSYGRVSLIGAQVSGDFDCHGSEFHASSGTALDAERITVGGSVFLFGTDGTCTADATLDFSGAQISRDMNCTGGSFKNVSFYGATIKQTLYWKDIRAISNLKLSDLKVDLLDSDANSWPKKGHLWLDGFTYRSVTGPFENSDFRERWLRLSSPFSEQPYTQLARFLQDIGDSEGAKEVLSQMEGDSRENARQRFGTFRKMEDYGQDLLVRSTTGYGIYPLRAVYGLGLLAGVGWIIHRRAKVQNAMAPSEKEAYEIYHKTGKLPEHYPPFHPLIYSLENCIPLVKLGQDEKWQPDSTPLAKTSVTAVPAAMNWRGRTRERAKLGWEWVAQRTIDPMFIRAERLRWVRWILIMLGWILATFFAAGIAGIVKGG